MNTHNTLDYDVIVIGGGPGGSSSATFLGQAGKRVLLLEREKFPRYHIGESLLSGTLEIFRKLDVLDQLENKFTKKWGVEWIWGDTRKKWTTYFRDAVSIPYDYGFQVERAEFDKILLDNSRRFGVEVKEECQVNDPIMDGDRICGVVYTDRNTGKTHKAHAKWVIDASGQGGVLTKGTQKPKWDPLLQNMAVWSYWKNAKRGEGIDNGNTFLPTFEDGWWWFIPLQDEITSIGAVVDRQNLEKLKKDGAEAFYLDAISRTPELHERLKDAERIEEVRILKDWSYEYENFYGKGYVAVGDAACFIDPLFSTGVHLALLGGYTASLVVNTILEDKNADKEALLAFYQRNYKRDYTRYRDQVYFLYAGHAADKEDFFWKARSVFDRSDVNPRQAFISLIAGSFEHRGWYHRCLERMGSPDELSDKLGAVSDPSQFDAENVFADRKLELADDWVIEDDFVIEDERLVPSKVIRTNEKNELPLTPLVQGILDRVGKGTTTSELLGELNGAKGFSQDSIHQSLADAMTYGVVKVQAVPETVSA